MLTDKQWEELGAPFPAKTIQWLPQTFTRDKTRALAVAYIEARDVMRRLDEVCPGSWDFQWELVSISPPVPDENGKVLQPGHIAVKGSLTVGECVREDVGEGEWGPNGFKGAVSDALKRCGIHFGIGRYLYYLPKQWADWDDTKRDWRNPPTLPGWATSREQIAQTSTMVRENGKEEEEKADETHPPASRTGTAHNRFAYGSANPRAAPRNPPSTLGPKALDVLWQRKQNLAWFHARLQELGYDPKTAHEDAKADLGRILGRGLEHFRDAGLSMNEVVGLLEKRKQEGEHETTDETGGEGVGPRGRGGSGERLRGSLDPREGAVPGPAHGSGVREGGVRQAEPH